MLFVNCEQNDGHAEQLHPSLTGAWKTFSACFELLHAPAGDAVGQPQEAERVQEARDSLLEPLRLAGVAGGRHDRHVDVGEHEVDDVLRVQTRSRKSRRKGTARCWRTYCLQQRTRKEACKSVACQSPGELRPQRQLANFSCNGWDAAAHPDHTIVLRHMGTIRVQCAVGIERDQPKLLRRRMHLLIHTQLR